MPDTQPEHKLIRYGRLTADTSRRFEPAPDGGALLPPDEPDWIVPLQTWLASRDDLRRRQHPVAILLGPDADPDTLLENGARTIDPAGIAFIAIEFPVYTDGRGYSIAQILRTHLGWQGELRAIGDVLIDTVNYQARCGFDSFLVKPGHDPVKALKALKTFSHPHQRGYATPPEPQLHAA
ncbi:hypothetical protein CAL14_15280 [Bordetella genomosp. 9]|uniref:DUF934 domain-containing protein n=1 Tax=Bordetella genomosp. 9 TaxID=1416803 RepID=UPI000A2947C6|nr:DUF934 domain-containing protein [Bordetella genomosp. 9]ARP91477.1 hypothetical protein CAL14_15280 [Bordetella genomosp. 9]